jgi:hypothetical protein
MKERGKPTEHERRDWVVILVILLIGFLCVILAGGWAIRFAPFWKLDTNMGSNLDPDSNFLTNRPAGYFEPLDPSILTQPVWINAFLTPGASFPTRTPVPPTNTPLPTNTLPVPSNTPTRILPSPTPTQPYFPPPTRTSRPNTPLPPPATATDTNTPAASADLQITKTDNATHYVADATKTYVIVVTNNGPSNVTGATVTDAFTNPNILPGSPTWTCSGTGGGICTTSGSGNISDSVNLPAGASVTYLVDITVVPSPSGPLENTATVSAPSGVTDPVPGNNTATDSDTLITTDPPPPGVEIGPGDGSWYYFDPADSAITLAIPAITRDDNPDYDLVYYELANNSGIFMDHVIVQIGDGSNWYTILNWGDGIPDTNTSIAIPLGTPPNPTDCSGEPDNCEISAAFLRNGTGVQIDISIVPDGVYGYLRIQSLSTGDGDGADLDAIEILP